MKVFSIRRPFPFPRITRRVVPSEDHGDPDGDLTFPGSSRAPHRAPQICEFLTGFGKRSRPTFGPKPFEPTEVGFVGRDEQQVIDARDRCDLTVAGVSDPKALAAHRDGHCRASAEEIAASVTGNYRPEHLFTLRQYLEMFDAFQKVTAEIVSLVRPRRWPSGSEEGGT
jgi:hypothetical protein